MGQLWCRGYKYSWKISLAIIDNTTKAKNYIEVLEDYLLPFLLCVKDENYKVSKKLLIFNIYNILGISQISGNFSKTNSHGPEVLLSKIWC